MFELWMCLVTANTSDEYPSLTDSQGLYWNWVVYRWCDRQRGPRYTFEMWIELSQKERKWNHYRQENTDHRGGIAVWERERVDAERKLRREVKSENDSPVCSCKRLQSASASEWRKWRITLNDVCQPFWIGLNRSAVKECREPLKLCKQQIC